MNALRRVTNRLAAGEVMASVCRSSQRGLYMKKVPKTEVEEEDDSSWPRKVFSGIQPTGALHLGNYLGAIQKWTELQNERQDVTYCIVDMHSITMPQDPKLLRENIFQMAATMLACGIDPHKSTMFVQSSVKEHTELCWILNCLSTMARLGHLPQYKEKTKTMKELPLGLYVYPVLQAADIMLYKTTHVPVGEDQIQHIQLTQHLTRTFNTKFGKSFPICHAVIDNKQAARIRSLRDPKKKMSKSDPDPRATINITDSPDVIVEKFKKALTDFNSDVTYDPENRLGVSNLVAIHSLITGQSIEQIVKEAQNLDTARYKMVVADNVVEHLKPLRAKIQQYLSRRDELVYLLEMGAEKAREVAAETMNEVRLKVGLGAIHMPSSFYDYYDTKLEVAEVGGPKTQKKQEAPQLQPQPQQQTSTPIAEADRPIVPTQKKRLEKGHNMEARFESRNKAPKLDMELRPLPGFKLNAVVKEQSSSQKSDSAEAAVISAPPGKPGNVIYMYNSSGSSHTSTTTPSSNKSSTPEPSKEVKKV